jgi:hypothetical protein
LVGTTRTKTARAIVLPEWSATEIAIVPRRVASATAMKTATTKNGAARAKDVVPVVKGRLRRVAKGIAKDAPIVRHLPKAIALAAAALATLDRPVLLTIPVKDSAA